MDTDTQNKIIKARLGTALTLFMLSIVGVTGITYANMTKPLNHKPITEFYTIPIEEIEVRAPVLTKSEMKKLQIHCLQENVYFEARGEGMDGMYAVANVTINRTKNSDFPKTVCDVVYDGIFVDGKVVKHKCQFSWTCDGIDHTVVDNEAWKAAGIVATLSLAGKGENIVGDALYYHEDSILPNWAPTMHVVTSIGRHIFYIPKAPEIIEDVEIMENDIPASPEVDIPVSPEVIETPPIIDGNNAILAEVHNG